jgi:hypothetical protein
MSWFSECSLHLLFSNESVVCSPCFPMCAICPAYLILVLIALTIFGERYKT